FSGQTSYCMNPRANAYIFSEYNIFDNCKNPMEVKLGAVKSYNDVFNNCKGSMDGTIVTDKSTKVNTNNKYANFDTNSSLCYIPSGNYFLQTDTSKLSSYFDVYGGTLDESKTVNGSTSTEGTQTPTQPEDPTPVTNVYPIASATVQGRTVTLSWNALEGAEKYCIAYYSAGRWKIYTQFGAYQTTYTFKNAPIGTFKLVVGAKINNEWNTNDLSKRAVTVTVK
ncbi:hypothetical protein SAMN02910447_02736, partial [Ruminococcus sp. YE71]